MAPGDRVKDLIPRPHAEEAAKPPSRSTRARAGYAIYGSVVLRDGPYGASLQSPSSIAFASRTASLEMEPRASFRSATVL
jgi:hypothetical protein